jgi:O-antigen/teichoic acid export membrane protein
VQAPAEGQGQGGDRARAARSTVWSAVENGGLALVSFGSLVLYARLLSPAELGLFSIVLALVELLDVVVSMLFHDALVQRRDVTDLHFDTAFTASVVLGLALFGACWAAAPAFASLVDSATAAPVLCWTALRFPFTALGAVIVARQRRELAFKVLAIRSLVGRVSGAVLGIGLVAMGAGVWGLVAQQVAIAGAASVVLWIGAERRPRLRFGRRQLRELVGFGVAAVSGLFLSFAVKRLFTMVAGVMLGAELAGFLNIGFRAVDVLWAIAATAISQVGLPVLSRLQTDPVRFRSAYVSALEFTCLVIYPCFCGIALVAPLLVELLFGARWAASVPHVTVLGLLALVQAPRLLMTPALTALGRPREPLAGLAVELLVVGVLLAAAGAYGLTLPWAMAIWVMRELASAPVMIRLVTRATGVGAAAHLRAVAPPLLASACMAVAVIAARQLLPAAMPAGAQLAILVASGALVFLGAAWLFDRMLMKRLLAFVTSVASVARPTAMLPAPEPRVALEPK